MKYCSKCGNELVDEAIVCPKCGCAVNGVKTSAEKKSLDKNQLKGILLIAAGVAIIVVFAVLVMLQL